MGIIQRFYFWVGLKLGYLELNGVYEMTGYNSDGSYILTRCDESYACKENFIKGEK